MKKNAIKLIAILIFTSGLVDIASAFWARSVLRIDILRQIVPWNVMHVSRTLTLIIGFFLIFVARGLWDQKKRAWELAISGISISLLTHLLKGLDIEEVLFLLIPLSLLYLYRGEYRVQSTRVDISTAIVRGITIIASLFIYSTFGFFAFQGQFNNEVTFKNIEIDYINSIFGIGRDTLVPQTRRAIWFEDSLSVVGFIAIISTIASIFAPFIDKRKPTEEEKKMAHDMVIKYGRNAFDFLSLMDDKSYYFSEGYKSFIAYKVRNGVAVTLGDPIGEEREISKCISDFIKDMHLSGLNVVFTGIGEKRKRLYSTRKLKLVKIGEEAVLNTNTFNLNGSEMKDVRNAVNKIVREKITFQWFNLRDIPWGVLIEIENLHNEWLIEKGGPSLTFSVDFFPFPPEPNAFLVCGYLPNGKLIAAFDYFPYKEGKAMGLELMLRTKDAPNGINEAIINESVNYFKGRGVDEVSLGVAPLSNIETKAKVGTTDKTIKLIFDRFNQFYAFKSLFTFKKKFNPIWRHTFIAFENYQELPKVLLATLQVQLKKENIIKSLASNYLTKENEKS